MKNVSDEFKEAIKSDTLEIKGKVTFPGLEINDTTLSKIAIDADLVYDEDFEIGTAPMATAEVELVVDTGDEWGRNLTLGTSMAAIDGETQSGDGTGPSENVKTLISFGSHTFEANQPYTLSFDLKADSGLKRISYNYLWGSDGQGNTSIGSIKVIDDNIWRRYSLTFSFPIERTGEIRIATDTRNPDTATNVPYSYRAAKLEKGSIATPWTPAPEDYANYDYGNKECSIELGLTLPDETVEYVPQGLYTVEEAKKKNDTVTLRCVDRMYKAEREYISDLEYPTTVLDILESACNQCGIELAATSFANADYTVPNEPVYEGITCRDIFAQVAELAGGYAIINDQGKLEIRTLGVAPVRAITSDSYFDLKLHETGVGKIDRVIVKVGAEEAEAGTGDNIYTVVDNLFVQDPNNVVGPLYEVLKNVNYTACELSWQGDFSLDLGDKVTVDGQDTYILGRKFTYTGGQLEDVRAPAKSNIEKESTGKKSLTLEMANYKSELRIVKEGLSYNIEKVEEVEGDLGDLADRLEEAEFKITPNAIVQTVRQSTAYQGDLNGKVDSNEIISSINQTAEQIKIQANKIKLEGLVTANSNFKILTDGSIEAKNADITGKVTATSGQIGNWIINYNNTGALRGDGSDGSFFYIAPPDNSYLYLLAAYDSTSAWKTVITKEGVLKARGAEITGTVTATGGTVGDWSINNSIYSKHGDTYTTIKGSGQVAFATGAPDPNTTTGANLQIFHDGKIIKNSDGTRRILIDNDRIRFYDPTGAFGGQIIADTSHDYWSTILSIQPSSTGYISLHTRDPQTYGSDHAVIQVLPKSGDRSNRVCLETRGTNVASDYAHVELEDGWVDINASRGLWMYGTIYLSDGMGTPSTIRTLTSYDRQGLLIRADEAGNAAGINLYGENDGSYPGAMILRSGGQSTLYLDANRNARFYGDLRVDGAITNASINASQLTGTVASARLPIRAGSFTVTAGSSTSVSFSSSLPSTVRVVANVGGSSSTDYGTLKVYNVSTSGFSATLRGGATQTTVTCYYIAVGGF